MKWIFRFPINYPKRLLESIIDIFNLNSITRLLVHLLII